MFSQLKHWRGLQAEMPPEAAPVLEYVPVVDTADSAKDKTGVAGENLPNG